MTRITKIDAELAATILEAATDYLVDTGKDENFTATITAEEPGEAMARFVLEILPDYMLENDEDAEEDVKPNLVEIKIVPDKLTDEQFDDLINRFRQTVRVKGWGNVQRAFGES